MKLDLVENGCRGNGQGFSFREEAIWVHVFGIGRELSFLLLWFHRCGMGGCEMQERGLHFPDYTKQNLCGKSWSL